MQDALDPTIGQTEIVAMKKEIHRMQLQYELFRKEQEKLIKDMERCVFKRETIQLKYLPKVEKKNAQDRSSQGKLSRQVANLKQNLKHTTEQTMQLDSAIEQRKREQDNVCNDIDNDKLANEQNDQALRNERVNLLNVQLDKSKIAADAAKFKLMGDRYNEIATSKYQALILLTDLTLLICLCRPIPTSSPRRVGWCLLGAGAPEKLNYRTSH